jgi:hypothetical protein
MAGINLLRRTSNREIDHIDAILRILVRHRCRTTDPVEICRCSDVIDVHLDERLSQMADRTRTAA